MDSFTFLKIVSILAVTFRVVHAWDKKIEPLYEWKAEFNSSGEPQLISWNGTILRVTNAKFEITSLGVFTLKGSHSLYINSVDPRHTDPVNCKIPSYSDKNVIWSAVSLGNGKVVVMYGYDLTIAIVNVSSCADIKVYLPAKPFDLKAVVPGFDTFDVLSDHRECKDVCIYTYNDQGKLLRESRKEHKIWNIHKFEDPRNNNHSYYSVYPGCYGCTVDRLKILNSSYDVVEEYNFHQNVEFYSLDHGNLTVCDQRYDFAKHGFILECKLIDSDFNVRGNASIGIRELIEGFSVAQESSKRPVVAVRNLLDGGAVVLYKYPVNFTERGTILYRRIDADGRVDDEEILFIEHEGRYAKFFDIYLFEKDPIEGVYCGIYLMEHFLIGKCFKAV